MKGRFLLNSSLCFALLLLVVVWSGRVLQHHRGLQLDLGGGEPATLSPATAGFLGQLQRNLSITYFVSSRERMPSHLKQMGGQVRDLLEALRAAAPHRVEFRVIDPEVSGAAGAAHAARKKASSFRVRRVLQDEHREQKVWSSLVLSCEGFREVLIQGIEMEDLPHLEGLIVEHLKALEKPIEPTFAVAAPPSFQLLGHFLGEYGRVVQVDLDQAPAFPPEADVLFWMQPAAVSPEHIRQLQRFVDAGRTVVLAGSAYTVSYDLGELDETTYRVRPLPEGWATLLRALGLSPQPDLLMDRNSGPVLAGGPDGSVREVQAPFHLRCLPVFYNLKSFLGPARGGLSFVAASGLSIDPRRAADAGFQAEIVGTTTEHTCVRDLPVEPFTDADLVSGLAVPKQNLMVLLKPDDPWKGQILVLASASPFVDGIINQPGYAHQVFLRTLARTFAEPGRLARIRVDRPAPEGLPALGAGARLFWRGVAIFLVPLGLLALGVWRFFTGGGRLPALGSARGLVVPGALALAAIALATQAGRGAGQLSLDLTEENLNSSAPLTRQVLERAGGSLHADLVISPRAALPTGLKSAERRIEALFEISGIPVRKIRPEQLSTRERAGLREAGLAPFQVQRVANDTLVSQQVWSGLRLLQEGRTTVIPRLDASTLNHLEFLVVAALRRLEQGRAPHVAVISDLPRLSPAEALEDYQKKGLMAPGGADVYSGVKGLLRNYGYRVSHVDPREPRLPDATDLLLWLQPRRDSSPIILMLAEHLAGGGRAIVALQHFNIQQRQYRGTGFETVYWPQPQFQDLDRYLRLFGVEQVREVLMDRTQSHLDLETQVNRAAVREHDLQQVALPFLIRAVGAHFAADSPITRRLGDLLFVWGNRFALDAELLRQAGVAARPLISTSAQAWSFLWKGGFLPPEVLVPQSALPGRQPLSVLLQGTFPDAEFQEDEEGRKQLVPRPSSGSRPSGALLLIGCSEMFKNDRLHLPPFQHDQLLLNATANLAWGPELAALQGRRRAVRGFAFHNPNAKAGWRALAIGGGPLAILLYGWGRYRRRGQPLGGALGRAARRDSSRGAVPGGSPAPDPPTGPAGPGSRPS